LQSRVMARRRLVHGCFDFAGNARSGFLRVHRAVASRFNELRRRRVLAPRDKKRKPVARSTAQVTYHLNAKH
jgi:hypothetical protein